MRASVGSCWLMKESYRAPALFLKGTAIPASNSGAAASGLCLSLHTPMRLARTSLSQPATRQAPRCRRALPATAKQVLDSGALGGPLDAVGERSAAGV